MKEYWIRLIGAWFLLWLAGRLVKDAEQALKTAAETRGTRLADIREEWTVPTDAVVVEG